MKIPFIIIFLILCLIDTISSQIVPKVAPLNPDFVSFMAKVDSGIISLSDAVELGSGSIPPPGQISFGDYVKKSKLKAGSFAVCYDMRTPPGLLTPVKGQTNNACWAFATMASVESQWLKLGLGSFDLSENNLKYCHGFVPYRNTWGNHWMSTAYFARRSGPLTEADDPNSTFSTCPTDKIPLAYITEARYLPHDANTIKQAVLDHGAIYTMMYIDLTKYYNASRYTYYYDGTPQVNHAVDIIGWNDTLTTAAPQKGAWICRNSYGPGWGQNGYFYISYYDKSVLDYNAYWPARMDFAADAKVYGYDDLGNFDSFYYGVPQAYILVKYVATSKQMLSKTGTYAMAANTTLGIDIFDDFDTLTKTLSGPLSSQNSLSCELPGYYTFNLPTPITIEQGNDFYVRIRYNTPNYNYPIPIEYAIPDYANPKIESYVAWISTDPVVYPWVLIGESTSMKWDPCVKVYAEPLITWTGTVSSDWNTGGNWSSGTVPTASKNISIPNVATMPVVNQDPSASAACNHLNIQVGAILTIAAGKALTVNGTLSNQAGNTGLIAESGASLITKGNISGSATVKRTITGNRWHFISPPVSNSVAGIFVGKYLQQHTESTNQYTDITSVSEALTPAKGYALWGDNAGFTAQYAGLLNTGNQSCTVYRTAVDENSGWNLVGNPYPSAIDWDAGSGWTKTNLGNAIYIESNGDFASYVNGAATNFGSRFIAPGQGFLVNVTTPGAAVLTMTNAVRVHQTTDFFKTADAAPLIKLKVTGNGFSDEAIVRFIPDATAGFDAAYDALKLFGYNDGSAQIYTLADVPLAINTLQPAATQVSLGIHANTAGSYTLAASSISRLDKVMLEDKKTGEFTDLSEKQYTFSFSNGEAEDRFRLHFGTFLNVDKPENPELVVNSSNQTLYVKLKTQGNAHIAVYTVAGQLAAMRGTEHGTAEIKLPLAGVYIVKVITPGRTLIRKVMVF